MTNPTTDRLAEVLHQMATFQDGNAQPHTIELIIELADIARSQQAEIERKDAALRKAAAMRAALLYIAQNLDLAKLPAAYELNPQPGEDTP